MLWYDTVESVFLVVCYVNLFVILYEMAQWWTWSDSNNIFQYFVSNSDPPETPVVVEPE